MNTQKPAPQMSTDGSEAQPRTHSAAFNSNSLIAVFPEPKNELEAAIQRYIDLFDFAPIGYVTFDRIGRVEEINLVATQLLGRVRKFMVGCPLSVFVAHEDTHLFLNHLLRCRVSDSQVETDLRMKNGRGEIIYAHLCSTPVTASMRDGARLYQTAIVDLTERRKAEDALRQSEQRTAADLQAMTLINEVGKSCVDPRTTDEQVFEHALDAAIIVTAAAKGNIQLYEPQSKTLALVAQNGFQRRFLEFLERTPQANGCSCAQALHTQKRVIIQDVATNEIFARKPAKEILLKEGVRAVQSTPLVGSEGKVLGIISTYFNKPHQPDERQLRLVDLLARHLADYLERRQAEQKLFESEKRYRTLFDLVPAAVYTCAADGRILEFNRHAIALWRRQPKINGTAEKYCGSHKLFHPDGRPMRHRDCPMARVLRGQVVPMGEREILIEAEDGSRRNVVANPTALKDDQGAIIGAINCLYDITERKKAESELRQKKNELDLIVTETPFMLTRCSRDLSYRYVSDAYGKLVGMAPEKIAGKPIVKIMGKRGLKAILPYIQKVLSGQRVDYEMMVPFKRKSRFLHATYLPEKNDKGEVMGWISSLVDITERVKTEKALAEAGRQQASLYEFVRRRHEAKSLQEIYESALDAILTTLPCPRASILLFDHDRVMRFVASRGISASYRKKVEGHSPWKPNEKNAQPICIANIREAKMPSALKATILAEGIQAASFIPLVAEGKLIGKFMTYYNAPHTCNDEEITLALNIAGQLALAIERKRAEAALLESEEVHRAFFSQNEVGMARSDLKGRIVAANKKLSETVGYTESELVGKNIIELTQKPFKKETRRLFRRLVREGKPYHVEKCYVRKNRSPVWVNVTESPIRDEHGKTRAAVAVIRDISARKQAQEALENANRFLEVRVEERTRELTTANEQLQAEIQRRKRVESEILEVSEREQRQIGQELHDSVCQHLTAIAFMARSAAMRLKQHGDIEVAELDKIAGLINEGVTETRTIARGLHPVEMNPDGFTAALESLLQRRSQLAYRLSIDEEISISDASVALQLYRIASEAVINANKHARAREVIVRMRGLPKEIELTVTDDGVGLKKNGNNTGMGFHIMDYRARSIGARIEITSIKPHGTRVACYLPR